MSVLSLQANRLRKYSERLRQLAIEAVNQGFPAWQELFESAAEMRKAADTIEGLRNRLQTSDGQSCYATQANYEHCKYSTDRGWRDVSRFAELFGTPERAARVIVTLNNCRVTDCIDCWARGACRYYGCGDDYDALLEWLRGESE